MSSSLSSASLTRESNSKCLGIERLPKTRSGKILRGTMQKIADSQDYKIPATIDDANILPEIAEALRTLGYASRSVPSACNATL